MPGYSGQDHFCHILNNQEPTGGDTSPALDHRAACYYLYLFPFLLSMNFSEALWLNLFKDNFPKKGKIMTLVLTQNEHILKKNLIHELNEETGQILSPLQGKTQRSPHLHGVKECWNEYADRHKPGFSTAGDIVPPLTEFINGSVEKSWFALPSAIHDLHSFKIAPVDSESHNPDKCDLKNAIFHGSTKIFPAKVRSGVRFLCYYKSL